MTEEIKSVYEIQDEILKFRAKCPSCDAPFKFGDIQWYEHDDGIVVKESPTPLWIYFDCRKCQYQTTLWKIYKQLGLEEAEEEAKETPKEEFEKEFPDEEIDEKLFDLVGIVKLPEEEEEDG